MALNGGFEIPVEIIPQIKVSDNTSPQKFFTDLAQKGTAAINDVARAAGQPITQEVRFEVKGGQLEAYVRNTSQLLKQMEGATNRAMTAEERNRRAQVRQIEQLRKAEFKRIAEVEKRAAKARAEELKRIQQAVAEGQRQLEKERQVNIEIGKRKALRQGAMLPQRGSLAQAEQQLSLAKERLHNMTQGTAAYKQQQKAVNKLTKKVQALGGASKQGAASIVSGFVKAQVVMASVAAAMNTVRDSLTRIAERRDLVESLTVSFRSFGLTAKDAAAALEFTRGVSLRYGTDLENLDKTLRRIAPTIKVMGGSMQDTQALTQALAKRTAALGLNTEQTGRYLEAFAQVMGKGKLQSEELNQQFSELDGALRGQVAAYLQANYGISNLNKAMERGEVKAHMFANAFHAIVSEAKGLEELEFGSFESLMEQLESGEITMKQFNNMLDTLNLDILQDLGKFFSETLVDIKGLQLAFMNLFNTELAQKFFGDLKTGVDLLIFGGKGLILLLYVVDDLVKNIMQKMKELPVIGVFVGELEKMGDALKSGFEEAQRQVDKALGLYLDEMPKKVKKAEQAAVQLAGKIYEAAPALESWAPALKQANKELQELAANSYKNKDAQKAFELGVTSFNQAVEDKIQAYKELKKEIREKIKLEEIDAVEGEERIAQIDAETKALKRKSQEMVNAAKEQARETQENAKFVQDLAESQAAAAASTSQAAHAQYMQAKAAEEAAAAIDKQTAAVNRLNQANEVSSDFGVDQDIVNRVLSQTRKMFAVQDEVSKNWTIDFSKLPQGLQASQRVLQELYAEMQALQEQRNKAEFEQNELGDSRINIQSQINQLLKGGNEEMQQAVALQKKLADFKFQQNYGYNPASFAGARAAGGPVSGGSTYQVNELGREGFLSASGRLSEIKVPSFGSWKAPSSGEVIPAHVWSEIKAANSAVSTSASRLAASGASTMVSRRGQGGSVDNSRITNHVTIQSQAPIQAASELMVASAKRRRSKFRR